MVVSSEHIKNVQPMPGRDSSFDQQAKSKPHSGIIRTSQKRPAHAKERHKSVVTSMQKAKEQLPLGTLV
jgi:hypothetical protein